MIMDNDEDHVINSKSGRIEIMINGKADEVIKKHLINLKIDIKIIFNRIKKVSLTLVILSYCIKYVIK